VIRAEAVRTLSRDDGGVDASARLGLVEVLLVSDDAVDCARRCLEWLGRHAHLRAGLCLLATQDDAARLAAVASHGLRPADLNGFGLDLEERDHPLVSVAFGLRPAAFAASDLTGDRRLVTPLGPVSYQVFPLHGLDATEEPPVGLLLAVRVPTSRARDIRWVTQILGHRVARLRSTRGIADAERRLRRERALLYNVINAVPDPVLLTDTGGRMIIANARAELLLASREDESEGRRRAVALNNMLFSSALSQSAIGDAAALRHELLLVDPTDGSDLLFELLSTPVTDAREGNGIVSILRNVTDLRKATEEIEENYTKLRIAEAHVRAERDRLDLIIDSVADPIVVTDPAGNIAMMNAPAERLFTVLAGASGGAQHAVRANDAHFSSFVSNLFFEGDALRRSGSIGLVDPQTGRPLPVEAISGKIMSEHGEITAVVTILHDRTEELEKQRLYEQLKQASDELEHKVREATAELVRQNELLRRQHIELEQASALKSQFLANMSHEFRTPLNAILGYTTMLLQGVSGELSPGQKRNLQRVDSNAHHLLSIINDILDIARIEAGKMPLTITEFRLPALIAEVMAEVEPIIGRTKLSVTSQVDKRIPVLRSDRQKVKQVVINLLTNALKFTQHGSVRVVTAYRQGSDEIVIAVADTGIGIAPSDQATIFEDFRQADNSPTREYGGAGLGLSICRRLASMLGGQITLASDVGKGSTFTLVVPRRPRRR
jgi:signal transduction histidine kinase